MTTQNTPRSVTTLTDIVIPAGTVASVEPPHRTDYCADYVSVLIAHGNDRTSEWMMPLEDAISYGLVLAPAARNQGVLA